MNGSGSKFPLARLAAKYQQMQTDGRILSNRNSLEIIRTRIQQLADRIDLNEAPDRLKKIRDLWEDYKKKDRADNRIEARIAMRSLDDEFEAAYHDYAAWQQMFDALDLDRKMVEAEVKIAKEMKAILTAEQGYELAAKLLSSVIEAASQLIADDQVRARYLKRIQYEFARLVGDGAIQEDDPGSGGSSREIINSVASVVD